MATTRKQKLSVRPASDTSAPVRPSLRAKRTRRTPASAPTPAPAPVSEQTVLQDAFAAPVPPPQPNQPKPSSVEDKQTGSSSVKESKAASVPPAKSEKQVPHPEVLEPEPVSETEPYFSVASPVTVGYSSEDQANRRQTALASWIDKQDAGKRYVVKSNQVVMAAYESIPRDQMRIINAALGKVDSRYAVSDQCIYYLNRDDLIKAGVSKYNVTKAMQVAAKSLFDAYLKMKINPTTVRLIRWIQAVQYDSESKVLGVQFTNVILPFISDLRSTFTKTRVSDLGSFSRPVAARLYEIMVQHYPRTVFTISVAELRFILQLEEVYPKIHEFRRRVIDPAIAEINKSTGLEYNFRATAEFYSEHGGRTLDMLRITFRRRKEDFQQQLIDSRPHLNEKQAQKFVVLLMADPEFQAKFGRGRLEPWASLKAEFYEKLLDPNHFETFLPWLKKVGFDAEYKKAVKKGRKTSKKASETYPELQGLELVDEPEKG